MRFVYKGTHMITSGQTKINSFMLNHLNICFLIWLNMLNMLKLKAKTRKTNADTYF